MMKPYRRRGGHGPVTRLAAWATIAAIVAIPAVVVARAENIDPDADGSQYAYGENVGWLNAEPSGDGGPGVEVEMFDLSGWMWGENVGWISLSCVDTSSCATIAYGVTNDGGQLAGYAWSENAGWISFSCANTSSCGTASYGVTIDTGTGEFAGQAWSEILGWISFASSGPNPFRIKTGWTCSVPAGGPTLGIGKAGSDALLEWSPLPGATAYDVLLGELDVLRTTGGDFESAVTGCIADNEPGTSAADDAVPIPGAAVFYLVRAADCGGGTYDSAGIAQVAPRDAGIEDSGAACP